MRAKLTKLRVCIITAPPPTITSPSTAINRLRRAARVRTGCGRGEGDGGPLVGNGADRVLFGELVGEREALHWRSSAASTATAASTSASSPAPASSTAASSSASAVTTAAVTTATTGGALSTDFSAASASTATEVTTASAV